jgi:hypothetical protein
MWHVWRERREGMCHVWRERREGMCHVWRERREVYRVWVLTPGEKRKFEDMCRWEDNIKMCVKD